MPPLHPCLLAQAIMVEKKDNRAGAGAGAATGGYGPGGMPAGLTM